MLSTNVCGRNILFLCWRSNHGASLKSRVLFLVVRLSRSAGTDGGVYCGRGYPSTVLCDKTAEVSIMKVAEHDNPEDDPGEGSGGEEFWWQVTSRSCFLWAKGGRAELGEHEGWWPAGA